MQAANEVDPVIITEWRQDLDTHIRVQHLDCPKGFSRSNMRTIPTGDDLSKRQRSRGMRVSNRSRKQSKQWRITAQERSVLRFTTGG